MYKGNNQAITSMTAMVPIPKKIEATGSDGFAKTPAVWPRKLRRWFVLQTPQAGRLHLSPPRPRQK